MHWAIGQLAHRQSSGHCRWSRPSSPFWLLLLMVSHLKKNKFARKKSLFSIWIENSWLEGSDYSEWVHVRKCIAVATDESKTSEGRSVNGIHMCYTIFPHLQFKCHLLAPQTNKDTTTRALFKRTAQVTDNQPISSARSIAAPQRLATAQASSAVLKATTSASRSGKARRHGAVVIKLLKLTRLQRTKWWCIWWVKWKASMFGKAYHRLMMESFSFIFSTRLPPKQPGSTSLEVGQGTDCQRPAPVTLMVAL